MGLAENLGSSACPWNFIDWQCGGGVFFSDWRQLLSPLIVIMLIWWAGHIYSFRGLGCKILIGWYNEMLLRKLLTTKCWLEPIQLTQRGNLVCRVFVRHPLSFRVSKCLYSCQSLPSLLTPTNSYKSNCLTIILLLDAKCASNWGDSIKRQVFLLDDCACFTPS